jgi:hypothetical protein
VCRELNLEDSLEELMRELGADEQGRISYQEFLRRRLALRPEIDALRGGDSGGTQVLCRGTPEYLPTSSDNSLGKIHVFFHKKKLRGLSPQASYTDKATTACRRS